jgi:hypothetical protein
MKRSIQWAAALAVVGIAAGGCGKDQASTTDTSKTATFSKAVGQGNGMFGAIFTTNSSGTVVNGNIYQAKEDVYLNGGPKKPGAAGLPDGDYYYLITDPGCKTELAGPGAADPNDTSGKIITVQNGEFTALMQLAPFADTPNNGGEYKVYVTKVSDYDPNAKNSCFGFVHSKTKTDNYKVKEKEVPPPPGPDTFCISGKKCFDRNMNGICDSQEGPVAGISIVLSQNNEDIDETETSSLGAWSFCGLEAGDYNVREVLPDFGNWQQTFPANDAGHDVTITDHDVENLLFANVCHIEDVVPADPESCFPAPPTDTVR